MHAALAAPPPGSGHEEPSGLPDEKQTPPTGSENLNRTVGAARFTDGLREGRTRSSAPQGGASGEYGEAEDRSRGGGGLECREGERRRRRGWRGGARALKTKEKGGRQERTVTGRDTEIGGVVVSRRGRPVENGPGRAWSACIGFGTKTRPLGLVWPADLYKKNTSSRLFMRCHAYNNTYINYPSKNSRFFIDGLRSSYNIFFDLAN
jgi:hypothetical protein